MGKLLSIVIVLVMMLEHDDLQTLVPVESFIGYQIYPPGND